MDRSIKSEPKDFEMAAAWGTEKRNRFVKNLM
jgi:hypothetical protein